MSTTGSDRPSGRVHPPEPDHGDHERDRADQTEGADAEQIVLAVDHVLGRSSGCGRWSRRAIPVDDFDTWRQCTRVDAALLRTLRTFAAIVITLCA